MEFTPEQQTFIDNLIKEKYTAAYAKAGEEKSVAVSEAVAKVEAKYEAEKKGLVTESEKLKSQLQEALSKAGHVDNTAVNERIAALELENRQAKESMARGKIVSLAAKLNAVDPEQAATLIQLQTKTDDKGGLVVVNSMKEPRLNENNKPMTIEELVKEFMGTNTHLVKASITSGGGTQGTTGLSTGAAKEIGRAEYEKMTPQAQVDFIKSGGRPVDKE